MSARLEASLPVMDESAATANSAAVTSPWVETLVKCCASALTAAATSPARVHPAGGPEGVAACGEDVPQPVRASVAATAIMTAEQLPRPAVIMCFPSRQ